MKNAHRWTILTVLLALALGAAGCRLSRLGTGGFGAGEDAGVRMIAKERPIARAADYPISITANDYQEPYDEIAFVRTHAVRDDQLDTEGAAQLRDLARKVGADAVVRVSRRTETGEELAYRPGKLLREGTRFVDRSQLTGVAVRFRRGEDK